MRAMSRRIYRIGGKLDAYRYPSFKPWKREAECTPVFCFGIFIASRVMIMAKKLMALMRKQKPSPTRPTTRPAIDGPTSLALLNIKEFRAIAFPRSSLCSTISMTKDCRVGMSTALTEPRKRLKRMRCQTCT